MIVFLVMESISKFTSDALASRKSALGDTSELIHPDSVYEADLPRFSHPAIAGVSRFGVVGEYISPP